MRWAREEIRHIVGLQLDRVARSAASQGVTLTFDQTLIDHFAEEGYKPEFGARELKRLIRSELETALAREMLGGASARAITPAHAGTTRPNAWCSNAKSHRRPRPSRSSRMPRRRATHLDGGRGCRVRPHRPGTGMSSLPGLDRGGGRGRRSRGRLQA